MTLCLITLLPSMPTVVRSSSLRPLAITTADHSILQIKIKYSKTQIQKWNFKSFNRTIVSAILGSIGGHAVANNQPDVQFSSALVVSGVRPFPGAHERLALMSFSLMISFSEQSINFWSIPLSVQLDCQSLSLKDVVIRVKLNA